MMPSKPRTAPKVPKPAAEPMPPMPSPSREMRAESGLVAVVKDDEKAVELALRVLNALPGQVIMMSAADWQTYRERVQIIPTERKL